MSKGRKETQGMSFRVKVVVALFVLFLLGIVFSMGAARAAIVLGDTSSSDTTMAGAGANEFTWEHACTGEDRFIVVAVNYQWSTNIIDSVTYNGVAMDVIRQANYSDAAGVIYGLATPATGTNNVLVHFTATSGVTIYAQAISYTGVDHYTPYYAVVDTVGYSTTSSLVWEGGAADDWLHITYFRKDLMTSLIEGAGQVSLVERFADPATASSYKIAIDGDAVASYQGSSHGSSVLIAFAITTEIDADSCCKILTTDNPVAFGDVDTITADTMAFTILNCGITELNGAMAPIELAAPFSLLEADSTYSLAADVLDTFHIVFAPATSGPYCDTMNVGTPDSTDYCGALIVTGKGVPYVPPITCCSVLLSLLQFGAQDTSTSTTLAFNIKNCGDVTLTDAVAKSELSAPFSLVETDTTYSILAGDSVTFHVQYAPTAIGLLIDTMSTGHDSCSAVIVQGTGREVQEAPPGQTRVFYMAPAPLGSNSNDGSRSSPYLHLSHITRNVLHSGWGDTVMVMSGTHGGDPHPMGADYHIRGHPDTHLVIMADPQGSNRPVFDARVNSWPLVWSLVSQYRNPPDGGREEDDLAYIKIIGLDFEGGTSCNVMICGGTAEPSFSTDAHHITIEDCGFGNVPHGGNYDGLRFIGVGNFLVKDCRFYAIERECFDIVGGHYGTITGCTFIKADTTIRWAVGAGILMKGGSLKILVDRCYFEGMGYGAVYIGQATGLSYFRPVWNTPDSEGNLTIYEAKDIIIYRSVFNTCGVPVQFSATEGGGVYNCSFYNPLSYEMMAPIDAIPCGPSHPDPDNAPSPPTGGQYYPVVGNIAAHQVRIRNNEGGGRTWSQGGNIVNYIFMYSSCRLAASAYLPVHATTRNTEGQVYPETFLFSHNMWWDLYDTTRSISECWDYFDAWGAFSTPQHDNNTTTDPLYLFTPTLDLDATWWAYMHDYDGYGEVMGGEYINASPVPDVQDFKLQSDSPAAAAGSTYTNTIYDWYAEEYIGDYDYNGDAWGATMPLGAFATDASICCHTSDIAFSSVQINTTATDSFCIVACGDSAVVDSMDWACIPAYVLKSDSAYSIASGDTAWFVVEFIPTELVSYPETQDVGVDSAHCADVTFSGAGSGTRCCSVVDTILAFGAVSVDTTVLDTFYVKNCGDSTLHGIVQWDPASVFTLVGVDSTYDHAAGDSSFYVFQFAPLAATEYVETINSGHASCTDVVLTGTGTVINNCCVVGNGDLMFGRAETLAVRVDSFYIENCGGVTLTDTVHWWAVDPVFTLQSDSLYTILAGGREWFVVQFIPTAVTMYRDTIDTGALMCADVVLSGEGRKHAEYDVAFYIHSSIIWVSAGGGKPSTASVFGCATGGLGLMSGEGCIPPVPFDVVEDVDTSSCIISWKTNVPSNHQVGYKRVGGSTWLYEPALPEGNSSTHVCTLTGLEYGSVAYEFALRSTKVGDTICTYGWVEADSFLTQCGTDLLYSMQTVYEFAGTVYALWISNELCDQSEVMWREVGGYWNYCGMQDHRARVVHEVALCGLTVLKPQLTYEYRVRNRNMCDAIWGYGTSWSFNTSAPPIEIEAVNTSAYVGEPYTCTIDPVSDFVGHSTWTTLKFVWVADEVGKGYVRWDESGQTSWNVLEDTDVDSVSHYKSQGGFSGDYIPYDYQVQSFSASEACSTGYSSTQTVYTACGNQSTASTSVGYNELSGNYMQAVPNYKNKIQFRYKVDAPIPGSWQSTEWRGAYDTNLKKKEQISLMSSSTYSWGLRMENPCGLLGGWSTIGQFTTDGDGHIE